MKATELRIGNLLWDDIFLYEVGSIEEDSIWGIIVKVHNTAKASTEDFYRGGDYHLNIDNFSGIPLTEEWLLKFGFKFCEGETIGETTMNDRYIKNNFWLNHWINGKLFYWENRDDLEIQYVHQLQNLYFALTGEELTTELVYDN